MAAQKKQQRGGPKKPSRSAFRPKAKAAAKAKSAARGAKQSKVQSKSNPPVAKQAPTATTKAVKARKPRASEARPVVELGAITVPSGKLAVFDVGLVGYLPREALEPALIVTEVPADRALPVVGARLGKGRFADCWDHVSVVIGEGDIARSRKLGEAGVDFARLVCMDHATLDRWVHDESLDGKADFVFWGRDAGALARAMRAPANPEGHGWVDLAVADAEAKADAAARLKAENHWLLATDLRRHSHHYQVLAAARASGTGSGMLEIAGARLCLFFTSWGDGVFPVYLDADAAGQPIRVRIQLATSDPATN